MFCTRSRGRSEPVPNEDSAGEKEEPLCKRVPAFEQAGNAHERSHRPVPVRGKRQWELWYVVPHSAYIFRHHTALPGVHLTLNRYDVAAKDGILSLN